MSPGFEIRKQKILEQLTVPEDEYSDRSPKGSIDEGIRELVDEINAISGLVSTSSCAGRISIFLEGKKKNAPAIADELNNSSDPQAIGGPGGKGGGKWLFVSHDPLAPDIESSQPTDLHALFGLKACHEEQSPMPAGAQLVHFKFEAMVCDNFHVFQAQLISDRYCTSSHHRYKMHKSCSRRPPQRVFVKAEL
jgi:tRNA wybutosine-synthesizing protein 3